MTSPPSTLGPWKIGKEIGRGRFSGVYECSKLNNNSSSEDTLQWVVKLAKISNKKNSNVKRSKTSEDEISELLLSWENQLYNGFVRNHKCFPKRPISSRDAYGEDQGWRWLALERIQGGTLHQQVMKYGISTTIACNITARLIHAFQLLHSRGILFRDVKPENIMIPLPNQDVVENRGIVLIDFGAACKYILHTGKHQVMGGGSSNSSDAPVGTPKYMSIFVHQGLPPSPRDDLESLGYLWMWMLRGGELPWDNAKSEQEVIKKKSIPLHTLCSGLPSQVVEYFTQVRKLHVEEVPDYDEFIELVLQCGKLKSLDEGISWGGTSSSSSKVKTAVARPAITTTTTATTTTTTSTRNTNTNKKKHSAISMTTSTQNGTSNDHYHPTNNNNNNKRQRRLQRVLSSSSPINQQQDNASEDEEQEIIDDNDDDVNMETSNTTTRRRSTRIAKQLGMAAVLGIAGAAAAAILF
jgi:serine/threonine protein kinase